MLNPLVIGDISARIPVIQGGMGVGISLGNLAGHVAKEGGIGIISTAQIGFNEADYETSPLKANLRAVETQFKKAKEIAKNGIVGFNIMVATFDYEKYVSRCIEVGADVIICGAGLPVKLPELVKGTHTKFAPILSSSKAVKVLFSMWKKRYNMTADFLVVEGPEAGGHLGFSADTLEEDSKNMDDELMKIIDTVHDFEVEFGRKIPVVFGGGVFDKQDIEHYLTLGCSGVQMATRFVCTEECDAPQSFKDAYITSNEEDIIITKSPVGMPGRAIKNSFTERVKTENIPIEKCHNCLALKHCDRKTIPYCISETLLNSAHGETDNSLVFAGSNAYKIHEMSTVKEIMNELSGD